MRKEVAVAEKCISNSTKFYFPNQSNMEMTCVLISDDNKQQPEASRETSTYWKAVNIPSSSSSSHGSILPAGPDRWRNEQVERVGWTPRPHHRQKAQSVRERAPVLLPESNSSTKKSTSESLKKKKIPKLNFLCVCAYVYVWVCSWFSFSFFHS